jgi:hypothetical protein
MRVDCCGPCYSECGKQRTPFLAATGKEGKMQDQRAITVSRPGTDRT